MAKEPADWRQASFDVYRLAWSELLAHWPEPQRDDVRYYVEELKEALLDLKQATIAEEPARAMQHLDEVTLLLAELRLRSQGD